MQQQKQVDWYRWRMATGTRTCVRRMAADQHRSAVQGLIRYAMSRSLEHELIIGFADDVWYNVVGLRPDDDKRGLLLQTTE